MIKKSNISRMGAILAVTITFFSVSVIAQKTNKMNAEGKRVGTWKKYHKNGKIRYEGQFENGTEVGVFKFYSMLSSKQPVIIKDFSNGKPGSANVKYYSLSGKLRSEGIMEGKNRVGKWIYYMASGKISSEENYLAGKLDGEVRNYYPNGFLTELSQYKNGQKHGSSKIYTEDGIMIEDVNYVAGKKHGEGKYFDLKGQLKEKGNYENGRKVGKWEFYMNGELAKKKKKRLSEYDAE